MTEIDLLYEDAAWAKETLPAMTNEACLAFQVGSICHVSTIP